MKRPIILATLIAALLLAPVAWWQQDALILGLAGLIPFFYESKRAF